MIQKIIISTMNIIEKKTIKCKNENIINWFYLIEKNNPQDFYVMIYKIEYNFNKNYKIIYPFCDFKKLYLKFIKNWLIQKK